MEYFRMVNIKTTEDHLQKQVTLNTLEEWNNLLFCLDTPGETEASIGGIWGEFTLSFSRIKGGVRFALLECPNALCWTVTTGYPPDPESIVVHLTINRQKKDQEFMEEVQEVLDDMAEGLYLFFSTKK